MVAGHLQEKKGYFYIVLSYPDVSGKRKTKWIPTSLPVKGNKKKAEKLLMEARGNLSRSVSRSRTMCCSLTSCSNGLKL